MRRYFYALLAMLLLVVGCSAKPVPVTVLPPIADFKVNSVQGFAPLNVSFTDLSQGDITHHQWDFGDGHFSSERAPGHTYASPRVYTVSLAVMGPSGSDVETKADYIEAKCQAISWEEADNYIGQTKTVEGVVVGTYYAQQLKGQPTFLNFHKPYKDCFKCVIWGTDRDEFLKAFPPNPETRFLNKRVRVTGPIKEYPRGSGVPEIILKEPSQVEVVGE